MSRQRLARGFTLIELLVVVAIIAILAAILFPVFAQAREKARSASCQSNLKQNGAALMMYAQDFDERFPVAAPGASGTDGNCAVMGFRGSWAGWPGNLYYPYTKNTSIYSCPSKPNFIGVNRSNNGGPVVPAGTQPGCNAANCCATAVYWAASYSYNYRWAYNRPVSDLFAPAELFVIADGGTAWWDCQAISTCGIWAQRDICWYHARTGRPYRAGMVCAANCNNTGCPNNTSWHNDGNNYLYADGHVKWNKWDQLKWRNFANITITDIAYNLSMMDNPGATP
jgi:prepilin-type N-terminal cleavage/methylation domain-containing protein/prepilin-type processing-associated H-X9-DG protein